MTRQITCCSVPWFLSKMMLKLFLRELSQISNMFNAQFLNDPVSKLSPKVTPASVAILPSGYIHTGHIYKHWNLNWHNPSLGTSSVETSTGLCCQFEWLDTWDTCIKVAVLQQNWRPVHEIKSYCIAIMTFYSKVMGDTWCEINCTTWAIIQYTCISQLPNTNSNGCFNIVREY